MRVSKDRIDMDDRELQRPVLKDYGEAVVTDNSGSSYTVDLEQGNVFDITLTDNCSFTFANPPASGTAGSITLFLTQDATGGRTVTWPAAVEWVSGSAPTLKSGADELSIVTVITLDGGTTWHGTVVTAAGGSVETADLADGAVTFPKLADAAVVTEAEGIGSNDNDTTVPTSAASKDYADSVAIGVGQTWQNVTGSRTDGTSYQNTTGRPIFAAIYTNDNVEVSDDNSNWTTVVGPSSAVVVSIIVPNNWYYRVASGGSIFDWAELR